jgi:uncharacterized membrane protein
MKQPFEFIPVAQRRTIFFSVLLWTLILLLVSQILNSPLMTANAPAGIISLELARSPYVTRMIVDSWDYNTRLSAAFVLGFDFLFLVSYAFAFSLALLLQARKTAGIISTFKDAMAWAVLLAAFLDMVENIGLFISLNGHFSFLWSELSFWCATIKFTILSLTILLLILGLFISRKPVSQAT